MGDFVHYNFFLVTKDKWDFEPPKVSGDRKGMTSWEIGKNWRGNSTGGQLDETMEIFVIIGSWMPDMIRVNLKWRTLAL